MKDNYSPLILQNKKECTAAAVKTPNYGEQGDEQEKEKTARGGRGLGELGGRVSLVDVGLGFTCAAVGSTV